MRSATEGLVEHSWAGLFDVDRAALWCQVTARPHRELHDYPGWLVAWRNHGLHVSVPDGPHDEVVEAILGESLARLQDASYWELLAARLGLRVIGPGVHHYLDRDPGPAPTVVEIPVSETARLRSAATEEEWQEAGMDDDVLVAFGRYDGDELVAVSTLAEFAGAPRHIGVLVASSARGRALVDDVGRGAASYAVRHHQLARWRARPDNRGSSGAASRLGFEPWCTQLALR